MNSRPLDPDLAALTEYVAEYGDDHGEATAAALVDIAQSLRDIRDELKGLTEPATIRGEQA